MRIAILGAGFQGSCVALELATRGISVDLYDRNETCITQAGLCNEGKIHLGFVYANDPSMRTARLMLQGALAFDRAVRRWIETDIASVGISPPFDYVVHRDSMLNPEQIVGHFAKITEYARQASGSSSTYLGEDACATSFRVETINRDIYDPATVSMVLSTTERAVNTTVLARVLNQRISGESKINFMPRSDVRGVWRNNCALDVQVERDGAAITERYDHVVNCLWDGRLVVDHQIGFVPDRPWLFRLKHGIRLRLKRGSVDIPTVTVILGSFGDVVRIDDEQIFLSWYPACLAGIAGGISPPPWPRDPAKDVAGRIVSKTIEGLGEMVLPLRGLTEDTIESAVVAGGIIAAAGETDIDDPESRLHMRIDVGVRSANGYHSIDTGKYTLAPMYALEVADRIAGPR